MKRILAITVMLGIFGAGSIWADPVKPSDQTKASYLKKAESEIQEWTDKLKSLEEHSEKSGAETRQELEKRTKVADEKLAEARKKLDALRTSSEGTWKSLRKGLEDALRDVKHALKNAQSFFNKNEKKKEGSS